MPETATARSRSAVQRCSKIILEIIMRRAERAWKGLGKSTLSGDRGRSAKNHFINGTSSVIYWPLSIPAPVDPPPRAMIAARTLR